MIPVTKTSTKKHTRKRKKEITNDAKNIQF